MKTTKVIVTPYRETWPRDFEAIRAEIAAVLKELALSIEHVGSTSVPGLSAKPIIDLDVVIRDYSVFPEVCRKLESIGYFHEGNLGIPEREAFRYDGKPHLQKHHLYVCPQDSRELHRHMVFREFLRSHPDAAKQYGAVKEAAAQLYPEDINGYMDCKAAFIEELYRQCGL